MPAAYEAMRDKFAQQGMGYDAAQGKAARIYNSQNPGAPVTGRSESSGRSKQRERQKKKKKNESPAPRY